MCSLSQVYAGNDLQTRVNGLDPRTEYTMRVAAIRVLPTSSKPSSAADLTPSSEQQLVGSYSTPCVFTTLVGATGPDGGGITAVEARGGLGSSAAGTNVVKVRVKKYISY